MNTLMYDDASAIAGKRRHSNLKGWLENNDRLQLQGGQQQLVHKMLEKSGCLVVSALYTFDNMKLYMPVLSTHKLWFAFSST